jgi:tetratricopeptide (TPR) repeat protein
LCLAAAAAGAHAESDRLMAAGVKEFTTAYQAWDAPGFARAADLFGRVCADAPDAGTHFYWKGVAELHRLLELLGQTSCARGKELARTLKETTRALRMAVELNERDGESHALLATAYGLSIAASPTRSLWLGPRVMKHQKRALERGATNPRVHYLLGMSHYHAPEMLGGKKEALQHLLRAEELFAEEAGQPAGPLEPRWGRSSCLAFIGKTYDALGKPADARKYYGKALEVNPRDQLARAELERPER